MARTQFDEASASTHTTAELLDERLDRAQRREATKASKVQDDPTYRVGQLSEFGHPGPLGAGSLAGFLIGGSGPRPG